VSPPSDPVLLIEDNDRMRPALARLLRYQGYQVVEMHDGQDAWDYLQRGGRASVIVLDLVMPRLDGRRFRAKQLQDAECAQIPVVVFTADQGDPLPDVAGYVRKTDAGSLLDLIALAAHVPALKATPWPASRHVRG